MTLAKAAAIATRAALWNSFNSRNNAPAISRNVTAQIEFSMTLPRSSVVMTACQEKHSANTINGTTVLEMFRTLSDFVNLANSRRVMAHCAAKQTSATVATERPINTLDNHMSNRQIR